MNWLIGTTGVSLFDSWFVIHFAFWIVVGAHAQLFGWSRMVSCLAMLVAATAWELFERGAFKWWPEIWKHQESWLNAVVGDVCIAGTLGLLLGYWLVERQ